MPENLSTIRTVWESPSKYTPPGHASIREYSHAEPYRPQLSAGSNRLHDGTPDGVKRDGARGSGGFMNVPGRILATLQRKFWDSNKVRPSSFFVT